MAEDTVRKDCLYCGAPLKRHQILDHYQYCSKACYYAARYGEKITWGNITVRGAKRVEALKLCRDGMTQREAAETLGIHHSVIARLFIKHGADVIVPERACAACGKSLAGFRNGSKYCSKECEYKMLYSRTYGRKPVPMDIDLEVRQLALDLYWEGYDSGFISRSLNVLPKTVRSWVHRYGFAKERKIRPREIRPHVRSLRLRLNEAETSEEWTGILEAAAETNDGSKMPRETETSAEWRSLLETAAETNDESSTSIIRLFPAGVYGHAEWGYYAGIVIDFLKMNPFNGDIFVFCNLLHNTITAITWRNDTFILTRAQKVSGTYIWPPENTQGSMLVSNGAFRLLLSYQKQKPCQKVKKRLEIP